MNRGDEVAVVADDGDVDGCEVAVVVDWGSLLRWVAIVVHDQLVMELPSADPDDADVFLLLLRLLLLLQSPQQL